jgi:hypothetical protein
MNYNKPHQQVDKNQNTTLTISVEYNTEKLNKIIKIYEKENQDYIFEIKKIIPEIFDRFLELNKHELNGNKNQIDI